MDIHRPQQIQSPTVPKSPSSLTPVTNTPIYPITVAQQNGPINLDQLDNSYTAPHSPLEPESQEVDLSFAGDDFTLNVSLGKLVVQRAQETPVCVPLLNIKAVTLGDDGWSLQCKSLESVLLGKGEGVDAWVMGGLRAWDKRAGVQKDLDSSAAFTVSSLFDTSACPSTWGIHRYNENFDLCETYPQAFIAPNSLTREDLALSAKTRVYNRLSLPASHAQPRLFVVRPRNAQLASARVLRARRLAEGPRRRQNVCGTARAARRPVHRQTADGHEEALARAVL